ncbi:MAG: phage holin family protein [Acidobacteriota bacterium]
MGGQGKNQEAGFIRLGRRLLSDLASVAGCHLSLARREILDHLRSARHGLAACAIAWLVLQSGLMVAAVGLALWAARVTGSRILGFLLVGSGLMLAGGCGLLFLGRRIAKATYLPETRQELEESRRWLEEEILPGLGLKEES